MNPKQVAKVLGMSYASVLAYLRAGVFPGAKKTRGTRWDIPDEDIRAFKKGNLSASGAHAESAIERRFVAWVENDLKLRTTKGKDPKRIGFNDRIVWGRFGKILLIEFKTEVGERSKHQQVWHRWLKRNGYDCITVKSLMDAKVEVMRRYENREL